MYDVVYTMYGAHSVKNVLCIGDIHKILRVCFLLMKNQYMDAEELKLRTKQFAIDVAGLTQSLPENRVNNAYCNQIVRSASFTGANYRAARRAKSKADHISKLKIVEEELDESLFFLELLLVFNPLFEEKINSI